MMGSLGKGTASSTHIADWSLANFVGVDDISAYTALPEPGTLALAGLTLSGLLGARLRRG